MAKRDSSPLGAPCWVDLFTSDPDRARAFYGEVFGWTSEAGGEEFGGYVTFFKDGVRVAGCMRNDGTAGVPDAWTVYLATADAKAAADAALASGGSVYVPAMEVLDLGSMAVLGDAGGAAVGVWQPGTHTGFGLVAEPGAPCWFELATREHDASVAFYQAVFGLGSHVEHDSPEMRYSVLTVGEEGVAGVMDASTFLPEGVPSHWAVYLGVPDTDAALATITALGGTVLQPAEDTPYGRLAQAADPTGAMFKLMAG